MHHNLGTVVHMPFSLPGVLSVLTLDASVSYNFLTASLIWGLLASLCTMKTRVLLSLIFFMADSLVRRYFTMVYWSILHLFGVLLQLYLGSRCRCRVLGRRKCTEVCTFLWCAGMAPFITAFFAGRAFDLSLLANCLVFTGLGQPCQAPWPG